MTQPQAILFDMDGTIVDTEPLWEAAEARALADMGTKMTPDMRAQLLGSTLPRMVALLRSFAAHPLDEAVVGQRVEQGVIDLLDEGLPWKVGLRELLEWANSKGIPTAVVTATRRHVASRLLRVLRQPSTATTSPKESPRQRATSRQRVFLGLILRPV